MNKTTATTAVAAALRALPGNAVLWAYAPATEPRALTVAAAATSARPTLARPRQCAAPRGSRAATAMVDPAQVACVPARRVSCGAAAHAFMRKTIIATAEAVAPRALPGNTVPGANAPATEPRALAVAAAANPARPTFSNPRRCAAPRGPRAVTATVEIARMACATACRVSRCVAAVAWTLRPTPAIAAAAAVYVRPPCPPRLCAR